MTQSPPTLTSGADLEPAQPDGLMVFDGVCAFCSASVATVLRFDRAGAIRFTAIQSPYGAALAAGHGIDAIDPSTFLFFDRGRPLERSEAVLALARRLGWPFRALAVLRLLPRRWLDAGYDWIAANRYRLLGKQEACFVPAPEVRSRFLDRLPTAP